ncbi:hypothetical protein [Microbacterium sp. IEGM 1404]|uniref:hypothetical protein n=1 Tax=Microbacterium sp. IEGM 1404 TaxID=3047084 RepID=UPI0024B83ED2|nr:hypothetical protein [Microbacterium sp. IEGM 1404]MDI9889939.1 hypothetical protein [Microbacterium sp. IEGM 1404]
MTDITIAGAEVDPVTGEVIESPDDMELVPLNLAALDEDALAQLLPTPGQLHAALIIARGKNAKAPSVIARYRGSLKRAETDLKVQLGIAVKTLREDFPRATLTELRDLAYGEDRVRTAVDRRDDAWLLFEYAKDFARMIGEDIEVLRSLNKNLRPES